MENIKSVAKNTAYLTFSYITQKILSFGYYILVAIFFDKEDIGKYVFALSFTTMFAVFIDIGLTNAMIREIAKFKEKTKEYLSSILGAKIFLSIFVYLAVVVAINFLGHSALTKQMIYLAGVIMVIDSFTLSLWGVLRGQRNLFYESISVIGNQLVIIITGTLILILKLPLIYMLVPFICGSIFSLLFALYVLIKKDGLKISFAFNWSVLKSLWKISLPLALIAIFSRIYGYIDQVMIKQIAGDIASADYGTAMKIPFALQFIPTAFGAATFPAFSNYYQFAKEKLRSSFERSMAILTILAIPMTWGIIAVGDEIMHFVFNGKFDSAVPALKVLMVGLIFVFLNFPLGSLLNACDRQKTNTKLVGLVMVLNIILNIFLIPKYSFFGASMAFVFCHGLLSVISLVVARKIVNYRLTYILEVIVKSALAGAIMALLIIVLKQYVNFIILIPIGAIFYVIISYLIKAFTKEDVAFIINSVVKQKNF